MHKRNNGEYKSNLCGESIESNPINVEENSRIKIDEKRTETINGFIPANIEDCKGEGVIIFLLRQTL